jgi:glutaconate CoA-transferase subunit B
MQLDFLHPGATVDAVRDSIGWPIRISPSASETPPPTEEELRLIREVLDPEGSYTR